MNLEGKLILNLDDLNKIIDKESVSMSGNTHISLIFMEGLINELDKQGIDSNSIDTIEIRLD